MSGNRIHGLADYLVTGLAALWYLLDGRHREVARSNLKFAYGGELSPRARERLALGVFRHFIRYAGELIELLIFPLFFIKRKVIVIGMENLEAALAQGRGAIIIGAHAGNWEYTVMGAGVKHNTPVAVVARELDDPLGRFLFRYLRQRGGNRMVDREKGLKEILRHLKRKRIVGILIDQNTPTKGGLLVDFFGKPARTTPVAALLARHRDIPVLPGFSRRLADGRHLLALFPAIPMEKTADPEADVKRHLELQSRALEAWVRTCPEQWLWIHRRWKNQFPEIYERRK
jgi:KDO2-lipid IV(A) lauroyltransferase